MEASFSPARFKRFLSGIAPFIALTFILVSSIHDAYSAQVTLEWDPNTEPDLGGYKLYYGNASGDYAEVIDVGNTTNKLTSYQAGKLAGEQAKKLNSLLTS
jgi:hypothetical protein